MKINKSKIRKIIKEELESLLNRPGWQRFAQNFSLNDRDMHAFAMEMGYDGVHNLPREPRNIPHVHPADYEKWIDALSVVTKMESSNDMRDRLESIGVHRREDTDTTTRPPGDRGIENR